MEEFSTIIYILFIILSIVGGLIRKNKKSPSTPKKTQQPRTHKSARSENPSKEKSFQEMIDDMLKEHIPQRQPKYVDEEPTYESVKYESEAESLEEIIQDEDDHRNTKMRWMMVEEEKSQDARFKVDNWQQAILITEVLGKPKALQ